VVQLTKCHSEFSNNTQTRQCFPCKELQPVLVNAHLLGVTAEAA